MGKSSCRFLSPDLFTIITILVIGVWRTSSIELQFDIIGADETDYLRAGLTFFKIGPLPASWGPLYPLWYWFLSVFQPTPIELYDLNHRVLVVAIPVVLFVSLRRLTDSLLFSILGSMTLLLSPLLLSTWPRVSHFLMLVILSGIAITGKLQSREKLLMFLPFVLLSCYIRPEFVVSYIGIAIYIFFYHASDTKRPQEFILALLNLLVLAIMTFRIGVPIVHGSMIRARLSFMQHFSIYWVNENDLKYDPFFHWETIMQNAFGRSVISFYEALMNYPELLFRQWFYNISIFFASGTGIFISLCLTLLVIEIIYSSRGKRDSTSIVVLVLLLPVLIDIVILYPRAHYALVGAALAIIALSGSFASKSKILIISAYCCILIFLLNILQRPGIFSNDRQKLTNRRIIYILNDVSVCGERMMALDESLVALPLYVPYVSGHIPHYGEPLKTEQLLNDDIGLLVFKERQVKGAASALIDSKFKKIASVDGFNIYLMKEHLCIL